MTSPAAPTQFSGERLFITDGGLETWLLFQQGIDLPLFAAFVLLEDEAGLDALTRYYAAYLQIAQEHAAGLELLTPTWRANPDWGAQLGYSPDGLDRANHAAVRLMHEIGAEAGDVPTVVSGCVGPRGDGYVARDLMSAEQAHSYHAQQVSSFRDAGAEMVDAITMTYAEEAIGITRACADAGLPSMISFTVETDGRLPSGQALGDAIEEVDAETGGAPAFFMVNCAHPTHFAGVVDAGGPWLQRIGGIRANASTKSHAELDASEELDAGDPAELARGYLDLRAGLPNMRLLGGCCGTDHRHVGAIADALLG
jgi:homocysteine S-methyltransferase